MLIMYILITEKVCNLNSEQICINSLCFSVLACKFSFFDKQVYSLTITSDLPTVQSWLNNAFKRHFDNNNNNNDIVYIKVEFTKNNPLHFKVTSLLLLSFARLQGPRACSKNYKAN